MEFDLHTYDIQDIILGLIMNNSRYLAQDAERVEKLINLFTKLNIMTNESNDYTLHFTVIPKETTHDHQPN